MRNTSCGSLKQERYRFISQEGHGATRHCPINSQRGHLSLVPLCALKLESAPAMHPSNGPRGALCVPKVPAIPLLRTWSFAPLRGLAAGSLRGSGAR